MTINNSKDNEINLTDEMFKHLSGAMDCNLEVIESLYDIRITVGGSGIKIDGIIMEILF